MPIRVLQVISSLNTSSGIANVVMNYYRNINRQKVQFDFLYFYEANSSFINEVDALGGDCYYFVKPSFKNYYKAVSQLKTFFKDHFYPIVHCHEPLITGLVEPIARSQGTSCFISHVHSIKHSENPIKCLRNRFLCRNLVKKSDFCFACSSAAAKVYYGNRIMRRQKFRLLYNAIDTKQYLFDSNTREKLREDLGIKNKFVLGNISRLSKIKNQIFLIKLLNSLKDKCPDCVLVLVGGGEDEDKLRKLVTSYGIQNRVIFTGHIRNAAAYYNCMDLFLFPSLSEGLGMALIEAQFNSITCIVSNRVPEEARISNAITFLPLKLNLWHKEVLIHNNELRDTRKEINNAHYNILEEARRLELFYLDQ